MADDKASDTTSQEPDADPIDLTKPTEAADPADPADPAPLTAPGESSAAVPLAEPVAARAETKAPKMSKADKLSAKAEQMRVRDARRAAEREVRADAAAAKGTSSRTGWVIATAVLAVTAVGLATVLTIGFFSWHHQREINDARAGSLKAAQAYVVAFGTYDYQHLNANFDKTAGLMTPAFAKNYKRTSAALAKTFVAYKTKVTASVPKGGAAVISVSTSKARVLVLLDQVITSSQSTTPKINRNRLQVSLVYKGNKWLVNQTDAT